MDAEVKQKIRQKKTDQRKNRKSESKIKAEAQKNIINKHKGSFKEDTVVQDNNLPLSSAKIESTDHKVKKTKKNRTLSETDLQSFFPHMKSNSTENIQIFQEEINLASKEKPSHPTIADLLKPIKPLNA